MSNYEHCAECDALTGRAGKHDDSLYHAHEGPFCAECYEAWDEKVITERDQLKAENERLAAMLVATNSMLVATSKAGIQLREQVAGLEVQRDMQEAELSSGVARVNELEAELAELKSQKPVTWRCRIAGSDHWAYFPNKSCRFCEPLYANPVAQLKANAAVPYALLQWTLEDEPESTLFDQGYNAARRWVRIQLAAAPALSKHRGE